MAGVKLSLFLRFGSDEHCVLRAHLVASVTTRASVQINRMLFVGSHGDGIDRAMLGTKRAANALVVDTIVDQVKTLASWAVSVEVCFVFLTKVLQG